MKKKNVGKWLVVLVALVAVSTSMIAGTFAKYTSEYSGSDTALVAKWDVAVEAGQTGGLTALSDDGTSVAALDLFSHKYNTNILATAGAQKIIAPGVEGEFVLAVTNKSDVAAEVSFAFEKDTDSANVPLVFSADGTNWGSLADIEVTIANIQAGASDSTTTVKWRWPFERGIDNEIATNDAEDTALGQASAGAGSRTEYKLIVKATATQLTPLATP